MTVQSSGYATEVGLERATTLFWTPTVDSWLSPTAAPVLVTVILLAAVGTTVLFLAGVVGYRRRRTVRHGTIAVVLGLLVVRSIVGLGTVFGVVPMVVHHLVEHGIDVVIAGLLLYVLYTHGSTSSSRRPERSSSPKSSATAETSATSATTPSTAARSRRDQEPTSRLNAESSTRSGSSGEE
ncbi:hypothetical protein B1756_09225 [Natrarchaeobaculum aegyptiacum]|uniref:Uncharacterized protein n=1 Tax=Natrarchaeobaculum aegyptiacum TaxID=745377 RepID=A0A2Z2HWD3_9EURY|nr:hypothetical protein B1756_09225 [Natrarchaeobaculum aegyptiacum]